MDRGVLVDDPVVEELLDKFGRKVVFGDVIGEVFQRDGVVVQLVLELGGFCLRLGRGIFRLLDGQPGFQRIDPPEPKGDDIGDGQQRGQDGAPADVVFLAAALNFCKPLVPFILRPLFPAGEGLPGRFRRLGIRGCGRGRGDDRRPPGRPRRPGGGSGPGLGLGGPYRGSRFFCSGRGFRFGGVWLCRGFRCLFQLTGRLVFGCFRRGHLVQLCQELPRLFCILLFFPRGFGADALDVDVEFPLAGRAVQFFSAQNDNLAFRAENRPFSSGIAVIGSIISDFSGFGKSMAAPSANRP